MLSDTLIYVVRDVPACLCALQSSLYYGWTPKSALLLSLSPVLKKISPSVTSYALMWSEVQLHPCSFMITILRT